MDVADLDGRGVVRWGTPVPCTEPGVYVVSTDEDGSSLATTFNTAPISRPAVDELLSIRPELTIDGSRPTSAALELRLASFWLPDEVVIYIGLAGTSLVDRVNAYYKTPLGARSPHAGGWFLKTLDPEVPRWVHWARSTKPGRSEDAMLKHFCAGVSERSLQLLADPRRPFPFANLEWPPGVRKRHGISGARARRSTSAAPPTGSTAPVSTKAEPGGAGATGLSIRSSQYERSSSLWTQQVTASDRNAGQIRVPSRSKGAFPKEADTISVRVQGVEVLARWNPRVGPDRERSGTLRVGPRVLAELVPVGTILVISVTGDGAIELTSS